MEFNQLRSLVSVAELSSISLAANHLHLSPPAIHKQLKLLESELDIQLYEKVGRSLQLTQAAEVLLPYFKDILAQHDSAMSAIEEWKGAKRGLVRIGTGPTSYVMPAVLERFRRINPGIDIVVETGNTPVLLEDLSRGSLDLSFLVSGALGEAQDISVETTWEFELVIVSHLSNLPSCPHLKELQKYPFILFRKGSRMQDPIDRYFAANGFEPRVSMRLDSSDMIKAMVRAGLGISMLPLWVIDRDLKDGKLHVVRQAESPLISKLALVRRKRNFVPRPVQAFIDAARSLDPKQLRLLTWSQARRRAFAQSA